MFPLFALTLPRGVSQKHASPIDIFPLRRKALVVWLEERERGSDGEPGLGVRLEKDKVVGISQDAAHLRVEPLEGVVKLALVGENVAPVDIDVTQELVPESLKLPEVDLRGDVVRFVVKNESPIIKYPVVSLCLRVPYLMSHGKFNPCSSSTRVGPLAPNPRFSIAL